MYRHAPDGRLAGRERQLLTPEQAEQARRALMEGATTREAAEALGIPYRRLRERLADQLNLRVGRGRRRRGITNTPFPRLTEDELWLATAEIRRSWTLERWLEADVRQPRDRHRGPRS